MRARIDLPLAFGLAGVRFPIASETTVGIIESTVPGAGATRVINPCAQCGVEEGVWSVAWPDLPEDELFLLCGRCMWRRFHTVPRGPVRRALVRKVFARRVFGKSAA